MFKNRHSFIMNVDTKVLGEHFCAIVSILWAEILQEPDNGTQAKFFIYL